MRKCRFKANFLKDFQHIRRSKKYMSSFGVIVLIEMYGVSKVYPGGQVALKDINLKICKGELSLL